MRDKIRQTPPETIDAEFAAYRIIREGRIKKPSDIDVDAIAMQLGVLVHDAELEGCEARLLRRGKAGVVRVRRAIREPGRRRFAVAHELGHWTCHADKDMLIDTAKPEEASGEGESKGVG